MHTWPISRLRYMEISFGGYALHQKPFIAFRKICRHVWARRDMFRAYGLASTMSFHTGRWTYHIDARKDNIPTYMW